MTASGDKTGLRSRFSRRAFLQGSSAAAAATALHQQVAATEPASNIVRGVTTISLHVNGQTRQVAVAPRDTLMEVLRTELDLTGTKPATEDGTSGASTVLVDQKPMNAETLLAIACQGKEIETVERYSVDRPDEVAKAFVKHDAVQCGFCTPGFVVAVRAFLAKHPHATEAEIRRGLNGNICRCGTYTNIVKAALEVAKGGKNG